MQPRLKHRHQNIADISEEFEEFAVGNRLLKAYRKVQEELALAKSNIRGLEEENQDLQQQLDILQRELDVERAKKTLGFSTIESKPPIDQMLEESKPYIRKLIMLYCPFVTPSTTLGPRPPSGILVPSTRFSRDVASRPTQTQIFHASLFHCLPTHLHELVGHSSFGKTFHDTAKNMKSHIVSELRRAAPLIIKGVDAECFEASYDRSKVEPLIALLSWTRKRGTVDLLAPFLYNAKVRRRGSNEGFKCCIFQGEELHEFIRVLFFGLKSRGGGTISKKSYGRLWGISEAKDLDITVIPVFVVLVMCVISTDTEVSAKGANTKVDWQKLLEAYIGEFFKLKEREEEEFDKVIRLFERIVFGTTREDKDQEDFGPLDFYQESAIFDDDPIASSGNEASATENFYVLSSPLLSPNPSPPATPSPPVTPQHLSARPLQAEILQAAPARPRNRKTRSGTMQVVGASTALPPSPPPYPPRLPPAATKGRTARPNPKQRGTQQTEIPAVLEPAAAPAAVPPPSSTPGLVATAAPSKRKAKPPRKPTATLPNNLPSAPAPAPAMTRTKRTRQTGKPRSDDKGKGKQVHWQLENDPPEQDDEAALHDADVDEGQPVVRRTRTRGQTTVS